MPIGTLKVKRGNEGLAVSAKGDLYVANFYGSVEIFRQGQTIPYRTLIGGPKGMLGVAVDSKENVYVSSTSTVTITVWAAGHRTPTSTLSIGFTGAYVAVDAAGDVFVSQLDGTQIAEFPAGSRTPVVVRTDQDSPFGLALDGSQNLVVVERKYINVYAPPYTGVAIKTTKVRGYVWALALNAADSSLWFTDRSQRVATRLTYPRLRDVESTWNYMSNAILGIALYPAAPL